MPKKKTKEEKVDVGGEELELTPEAVEEFTDGKGGDEDE